MPPVNRERPAFTVGQIILMASFVSIACFLSFYLGARFGPELFWGIDLADRNERMLLPEEALEKELEGLISDEGKVPLTFTEALSVKTAVEVPEKAAVKPPVPPVPKPTAQKEPPPKPVSAPPPPAASSTVGIPPPETLLPYSLQLGSFSSLKEAQSLQNNLKASGIGTLIQTAELPGKGTWYRVKAGNFPDMASAEKEKGRIHEQIGLMPLVVSSP